MRLIELTSLENGGRRNLSAPLQHVPKGWAVIPEDMAVPDTFPFVELTAQEIDGVMTVTEMLPGLIPEPEPEDIPPEETGKTE